MIVKCDQCQTRFRIPDEKVTEKGVKVRCTKCAHTFRIRRAGAHEVAAAATQVVPPPPPMASSDPFGGPPPPPTAPSAPPAEAGFDPFAAFDDEEDDRTRPGFFAPGVLASRETAPTPPTGDADVTRNEQLPPHILAAAGLGPATGASPAAADAHTSPGWEPPAPPSGAGYDTTHPAAPPFNPATQANAQQAPASDGGFDPFAELGTPAAGTSTSGEGLGGPGFTGGDFGAGQTSPGATGLANPWEDEVTAAPSSPSSAPIGQSQIHIQPPNGADGKSGLFGRPEDLGGTHTQPGINPSPASRELFEMGFSRVGEPSQPPTPVSPFEGHGADAVAAPGGALWSDEIPDTVPPGGALDLGEPPEGSEASVDEPRVAKPSGRPEDARGLEDRRPPGALRRVFGIVANVALATVLALALFSLARGQADGEGSSGGTFSLDGLGALFASEPLVLRNVSNGLYETRTGRPVFYMRGEVENRGEAPTHVRVRAEILDEEQLVRAVEVWAGSALTAEELHGVGDPEELARLVSSLTARSKPAEVGSRVPFVVPFFQYPPELSRYRLKLSVEAASAPAGVAGPSAGASQHSSQEGAAGGAQGNGSSAGSSARPGSGETF